MRRVRCGALTCAQRHCATAGCTRTPTRGHSLCSACQRAAQHAREEDDAAAAAAEPPQPEQLHLQTHAAGHLTQLGRAAAAALRADGQSTADVAAKLGTTAPTVRKWAKRARDTGDVSDSPRSGRPRKTSAGQDAAIVAASQRNHFASTAAIRNELQLNVSVDTVSRRFDEAGLPSRIAANKRHYTTEERRKRLSFARGYENWNEDQWEHVIFSDEKTFEGEGRKRQQRVRRPAGHRFDPAYSRHTVTFAPSHHVFACFCARGPGYAHAYKGTLDGKAMCKLVRDCVLPTAADYYDSRVPELWWLMHDNSPPFNSPEVRKLRHDKYIQKMEFPANSPDINPIENLWPRVQAMVDELHPTTAEAVADAFCECWPKMDLDMLNEYAQSMPERIAAVIEAEGDATDY